jgi:hypothetical protein
VCVGGSGMGAVLDVTASHALPTCPPYSEAAFLEPLGGEFPKPTPKPGSRTSASASDKDKEREREAQRAAAAAAADPPDALAAWYHGWERGRSVAQEAS